MSLSYITSLLLSLLLGLANTAGMVQSFTASYQGSDVRLEWRVSDAASSANFEIHRKKAGEDSFVKLADVAGTGTDTYTFTDDNLYKNTDVAQAALSYKLVAKMPNGTEQTITGIDRNPTAVQRSWGSIKVMFR